MLRRWTLGAARSDPYVVVDTHPPELKAALAHEVKTEVVTQELDPVWRAAPVLSLKVPLSLWVCGVGGGPFGCWTVGEALRSGCPRLNARTCLRTRTPREAFKKKTLAHAKGRGRGRLMETPCTEHGERARGPF